MRGYIEGRVHLHDVVNSTTNQYLPGAVLKLAVSLTFLVKLLGWIPLLLGFSAMLAIIPVNTFFSRRYAAAQKRLMKTRDEKLSVINEALQGIRQIKFSALEPQWEARINGVRSKELSCVWDVFTSNTILVGCWITSPILLAAVSLTAYARINGILTPSVAFGLCYFVPLADKRSLTAPLVSLGVFKSLEATLAFVPVRANISKVELPYGPGSLTSRP